MTSHSSHRPVSALRARMIEDMRVRGFSEKTRNDYIRNVRAFAVFIGRSPDTATAEDLRRFQLHQTQTGVRPPSINSAVAALRFFFTMTPATALPHCPPPGNLASGAAPPSPRRLRRRVRRRRSRQNHRGDRCRGNLATVIVDPPPTTPASASPPHKPPRQIPIDGRPHTGSPRAPSWGLSDAGPQYGWIGHDPPASETLHLIGHPVVKYHDTDVGSSARCRFASPRRRQRTGRRRSCGIAHWRARSGRHRRYGKTSARRSRRSPSHSI